MTTLLAEHAFNQTDITEDLSYSLICLAFTRSRRNANFNAIVGYRDDAFPLLACPGFDVTL